MGFGRIERVAERVIDGLPLLVVVDSSVAVVEDHLDADCQRSLESRPTWRRSDISAPRRGGVEVVGNRPVGYIGHQRGGAVVDQHGCGLADRRRDMRVGDGAGVVADQVAHLIAGEGASEV